MNAIENLDAALRAAIPAVVGVAKNADSTYRVDFAPDATDEQKAQAAQIVAAFDVVKAEYKTGIEAQILNAEREETPRRIAEAILTEAGKEWLTANRQKISALRVKRG
jgi:hypothetical protein